MTSTTIKVDAEGIAERHRKSYMERALADFVELLRAGLKLQEADWAKVRGLEFREHLQERDRLAGQIDFIVTQDDGFEETVSGCRARISLAV